MSTTASSPMAMPPSSAAAAFDLPAMPGPYEDFEFSLNLPKDITATDLNLAAGSPTFGQLFGLQSSRAPSTSGIFTPSASAPTTPKPFDSMSSSTPLRQPNDTIMSHSHSNSGSSADTLGLTSQPFIQQQPTTASVPRQMQGNLMFGGNLGGFHQQHSQPPTTNNTLFDANETSFLTNFLSNFEGWDFNPNLPMQMPSFADAEKAAQAYQPPQLHHSSSGDRRASRQRGGHRSKESPRSPSSYSAGQSGTSPARLETSINAAFGLPMQSWNENDDAMDTHNSGKKIKTDHGSVVTSASPQARQQSQAMTQSTSDDGDKRTSHILSEQRRRNHIREAFKELVDLLEAGREFGARGLGLSSGAGTGIEDEGLDDRSDYESTLEDEESAAATKRRKLKARRKTAQEQARKAAAAAGLTNGGNANAPSSSIATAGRGKGRGRGGSAGGGAGSKSAVLFQAVDLLRWLDGRNQVLKRHVETLEEAASTTAAGATAAAALA